MVSNVLYPGLIRRFRSPLEHAPHPRPTIFFVSRFPPLTRCDLSANFYFQRKSLRHMSHLGGNCCFDGCRQYLATARRHPLPSRHN